MPSTIKKQKRVDGAGVVGRRGKERFLLGSWRREEVSVSELGETEGWADRGDSQTDWPWAGVQHQGPKKWADKLPLAAGKQGRA